MDGNVRITEHVRHDTVVMFWCCQWWLHEHYYICRQVFEWPCCRHSHQDQCIVKAECIPFTAQIRATKGIIYLQKNYGQIYPLVTLPLSAHHYHITSGDARLNILWYLMILFCNMFNSFFSQDCETCVPVEYMYMKWCQTQLALLQFVLYYSNQWKRCGIMHCNIIVHTVY